MNPILDYKTSGASSPRLSVRTAALAGIVAGALTFGSIFLVGPFLYLGVGLLAGIVGSALAARASRGYEFRAGFLTSGFAAVSAFVTSILSSPLLGGSIRGHRDLVASVLAVVFFWALFTAPGMLGSLWF